MSWSMRKTVTPCSAGSERRRRAELDALIGVESGGGLVEQHERGCCASARATPTSLRLPSEISVG